MAKKVHPADAGIAIAIRDPATTFMVLVVADPVSGFCQQDNFASLDAARRFARLQRSRSAALVYAKTDRGYLLVPDSLDA